MLELHSLIATNFRSYRGTHKFKFPTANGLYYLTGENNTALGSNGAGKSTFLDIIVWVLFGRTTRGLKANEVISWGAASCQAALELTVGSGRLTVKRSQKPNNLYLNDKPVDQQELEKHIRLNYDSFTYSVISPQFGESFMALSPSAKLTLFSDIMNLDFWLQKSEEALKLAKDQSQEIEVIRTAIARCEGQLIPVKEDIASLQHSSDNYGRQRELKLSAAKKEMARTTNDLIALDAEIVDFPRPELGSLTKQRDITLNKITESAREHAGNTGALKLIRAEISKYKALKGKCPVCKQEINNSNIQAHQNELLKVEIALELEIDINKNNIEIFKKALVRRNNELTTATDQIAGLKEKKLEAAALAAKLKNLSFTLGEIKAEANPYAAMLLAKTAKLKELKLLIGVSEENKGLLEAEFEATSFWVKGFKRVRLFIIEQAFRTLEIEVNNSLAQLGMPNWTITFDVERENKSGGITKGFVVFVKSPVNAEPVRWENWSGGETQRLQLAGDLGLSNLIMQQVGLTNTVEFYDEPSTHLSPEGMLDLAHMLHERAMSEGKRIWIVDHASITDFGEFEAIIIARKDTGGSTIEYQ